MVIEQTGMAGLGRVEERFYNVDGLRTFARSVGEGRDVVLVHGAGVSSRYWKPAQLELASLGPFRVHALDLPGFGRSETPSWPPQLSRLAEHVLAWLDTAGVGECDLVGQSVGCEISVVCAYRRPEQFRRLVLAAPSGLPCLDSVVLQLWRAFLDAPRETLALYGAILPDYLRCGPVRIIRLLQEQLHCPAEEALPHLRQPTLVLRGEGDTVVSTQRMLQVLRELRHGEALTIPGAHAAHFTHAREFAAVVARSLHAPGEAGSPAPRGDSADDTPASPARR